VLASPRRYGALAWSLTGFDLLVLIAALVLLAFNRG